MPDPIAPAPDINLAAQGKPTEVHIDQVNQWMRASPWYHDLLRSFGQDPNNVHLSDNQKHQVMKAAQAQGVVIDEGAMQVDPSGNLDMKGKKLRNTLIVAGIAGATIATMGAAGVFAGAAGAGAGAAGGAGAGAAAAGAGAGLGASGVGGLTATSLGLGTTAGLGTAGGTAAALGGGAAALGGGAAAAGGIGGGTAATGAGAGSTLLGAAKQYLSKGDGVRGYLSTAADIGSALGANAQGRADGRVVEGGMNQRQDALAQQRYQNELAAARVNLDAPGQRASTSVHGDILANAKPFAWGGGSDMVGNIPVPKFSGGLSPAMFSDNTRALGSQMSAQALADNGAMGGRAIGAAPNLTELPQSGTTDSILNTASTIGNFADILGRYAGKKKPAPTVYDDSYNTGGN